MGHQVTQMDVESLQKSGSRRGRCLDVFLVVSILFLFVGLVAVAAGGVISVMELKSKLETRSLPNFGSPGPTEDTLYPTYKMENFAYLKAVDSALKTGNMALAVVPYGVGTSVGSNYDFNDKQIGLKPKKEGTYFIYTELNFTCTFECPAGVLSVSVSDKLTCEVELPRIIANGTNVTNVTKRCWTVAQINEELLLTQMRLPETGLKGWSLNLKGSGIGMFLVD